MTPEDKKLARDLLVAKTLTIDQVTIVSNECEATGRPFAEIAARRGWLPPAPACPEPSRRARPERESPIDPVRKPPRLISRPFMILLGAAGLLLLAGALVSVLRLRQRWQLDEDWAVEASRLAVERERLAREARESYQRSLYGQREAKAQAALKEARAGMAWVEERHASRPDDPEIYLRLVASTIAFTTYLESHPNDAGILLERARSHELRRNYDKAVEDLELAIQHRPDLEPAVRDRLGQLRLFASRKR